MNRGNPRWFLQLASHHIRTSGWCCLEGTGIGEEEEGKERRRNWGGFGKSTVEEWGGEEGVGWRGIG